MKRKILSLALALMMIISVAAALPVSAESNDVIISASKLTVTNAGSNVNKNQTLTDDYGWIPTEMILTTGTSDVTATVTAPAAGYYDLYIGATKYSSTSSVKFVVTCNDEWIFDHKVDVESGVTTQANAGTVYLEEGENTLLLETGSNIWLYGLKLAYLGTTAPTEYIVSAISGPATSAGGGPYATTEPSDNFGWIPVGSYLTDSNTTVTHELYVFEAGTYQVTIGSKSYGTGSPKLTVTAGDSSVSGAIPAQTAKGISVQNDLGVISLVEGKNTITVAFTSSNTYYQGLKLTKVESYTITANETEGGTAQGASAVAGESATITATPETGYIFDGWYDASNVKVSSSASYTIEDVQADATYTAKFKAGVVIAADDNIEGNKDGKGSGDLSVNPTDDYGWIPGKAGFLATTKSDVSYNVNVAKTGYYDLSFACGAYVSSGNPANNLQAAIYLNGSSTATFTNVAMCTGSTATADAKVTTPGRVYLEAGATNTIRVQFTSGNDYFYGFKVSYSDVQPARYTITATAGEGGTVSGGGIVEEGSSVTLTATLETGYIFDGWYDASNVKVSSSASYTIEDVQADATYTAKFKAGMLIEPRDATKHETTSNGYLYNHSAPPTYEGMTWGDGENDGVRFYYGISSFSRYLSGTITAGKTGYYDVMIAAATLTGAKAKFEVGGDSTEGNILATSSASIDSNGSSVVKENNIGRIYLTAGDACEYKLYATSGSGSGNDTIIYDIMLTYSDDQTEPLPGDVIVSILSDGTTTNYGGSSSAVQNDASSWIPKGGYLFVENKNPMTRGEYTATILEDAYYDIYFGASKLAGYETPLVLDIYDGDTLIASECSLGTITTTSTKEAETKYVASVYLTKGTHTITLQAKAGYAYLLGMKFVATGYEKDASTITFTDANGKAVTSATGGEYVFAEVVTNVAGAKLFLVQYTGSGAEKTMVATSYSMPTTPYSSNGTYFYRTALKTAANVGEVKAFLWTTDDKYIPLSATATASVN